MVETVDRRSGAGSPDDDKKPEEKKPVEEKKQEEARPVEEAKSSSEPAFSSPPLPQPDFVQLVQMFLYQAMISLGQAPNPITQKAEVDLNVAKHQIGFLELLEEKTKGNLSETEAKVLSECLHQVRLAFVTLSKNAPAETKD